MENGREKTRGENLKPLQIKLAWENKEKGQGGRKWGSTDNKPKKRRGGRTLEKREKNGPQKKKVAGEREEGGYFGRFWTGERGKKGKEEKKTSKRKTWTKSRG